MTTGLHTVADIYCTKCLQVVGWKYVRPTAHCALLPARKVWCLLSHGGHGDSLVPPCCSCMYYPKSSPRRMMPLSSGNEGPAIRPHAPDLNYPGQPN